MNRIPKILLLIPLLCALRPAVASGEQGTNLERISEALRLVAMRVYSRPNLPDTLCLTVVEHPADWVATRAFLEAAERDGREAIRCTPPFFGEVLVAITQLQVDLVEIDDERLLRRDVSVSLGLSLPRQLPAGPEQRYSAVEELRLSDTVERSRAGDLATEGYPYTEARYIATRRTSFWKQVAEPAVVLGTTVAMVVLLFTTRSQ